MGWTICCCFLRRCADERESVEPVELTAGLHDDSAAKEAFLAVVERDHTVVAVCAKAPKHVQGDN